MKQERQLVNEAIQRATAARIAATRQQKVDDQKARLEAERVAAEEARLARSAEPDTPNLDLSKDKKKAKAEHLKVGPLVLGAPLKLSDCAVNYRDLEDVCVVGPWHGGFDVFLPESKNPIPGAMIKATLVDQWLASVTFTFGAEPQRYSAFNPVAQLEADINFQKAHERGQRTVAQAHKNLRAKYGKPTSSHGMTYSNGYGAKVRDVDDQEWLLPGIHVSYTSANYDDVVLIEFDTLRRERRDAENVEEAKKPTF